MKLRNKGELFGHPRRAKSYNRLLKDVTDNISCQSGKVKKKRI